MGLIVPLKRAEDTTVPSLPLGFITTPTPFATRVPKMPAMNVPFWMPTVPIQILLASPATPALPISMLLLNEVMFAPAL